ncbi:MAG TPA: carboxypeptidase-like regulatory domain-containing protein [Gemmatimonadaceae bacterium]|nr:carboxypeptidase-like regulatory domain-containing protein [Gemmatimonadaceae bacterium]
MARPRGVVLRVVDGASGAGIDAAEVTAVGTGDVARTTPDGLVTLPNRDRLGGMEVRVRKLGFTVLDTLLQLSERDTVPIVLRLVRLAQLTAVTIRDTAPGFLSPAMQGFEARRKAGIGRFFPPDVLRKMEDRGLFRLRSALQALGYVQRPNPLRPRCRPQYILDGRRVADLPDRFDDTETRYYQAIEYYPSELTTPVQWAGPSARCGTLVFWSRER